MYRQCSTTPLTGSCLVAVVDDAVADVAEANEEIWVGAGAEAVFHGRYRVAIFLLHLLMGLM